MTVYFCTNTKFDLRAITTFGVNAKASSGAIGYFGTGLKYATAVLAREDITFDITTEDNIWHISQADFSFRDKTFSGIIMEDQNGQIIDLPFTTELGKNWTIENAYRELWSNTQDEGGIVTTDYTEAQTYSTIIAVWGDVFEKIHRNRYFFLLDKDNLPFKFLSNEVEVYDKPSSQVFYRGIAAYKLPHTSAFTYNFVGEVKLTEDRTIYDTWAVQYAINVLVSKAFSKEMVKKALGFSHHFENQIYNSWGGTPSEEWLEALDDLEVSSPEAINGTIRDIYYKARGKSRINFEYLEMSGAELSDIEEVKYILRTSGFVPTEEIKLVKSLGQGVLARAHNGDIYLTPECFKSKSTLAHAILEEHFHLRYGFEDLTRDFQSFLFTKIIDLCKKRVN